ncbi:MAG: hypothetical protein HUU35_06835, partial [Armatimonadetes bacterium]|nr:hypothetical protein [Armatimonadota bacterium]
MLISILTPFYTANPNAPEDARQWEGWLTGLATQAGPCEIIVAGTSPDERGSWQAGLARAAGPSFPHRLVSLHLPYRPPDPP